MAVKGCYVCLKYLLVVFNLIYWLLGVCVIAVAIICLTHGDKYLVNQGGSEADVKEFLTAIYVLFAIGSFLVVLGFLGCCGAVRESPCMLCTFFVLMVCVIVVEVGGGAQIWSQSEPIRSSIKKQLTFVIQEEYSPNEPDSFFNQRIDQLQKSLHCCGIIEPADWAKSKYNGFSGPQNIGNKILGVLTAAVGAYKVPKSCCVSDEALVCEAARQLEGIGSAANGLYKQGCLSALWEGLKMYAAVAGGVVAAAVGLQIIGLVFTLLLCCAVRRDLKD